MADGYRPCRAYLLLPLWRHQHTVAHVFYIAEAGTVLFHDSGSK
jgi:hypothetical protein